MAQPSSRLPPHSQPRSKANVHHGKSSTPEPSRSSSTPQGRRAAGVPGRASPSVGNTPQDSSDEATLRLIRRVLVSPSFGDLNETKGLEELLPPLTSNNEVDFQLYAIIAIVIKDAVYSWYGKITTDRDFVEEVVRIIAHCTRQLEQRARRVDLVQLALDEIPELARNHLIAYKSSHRGQTSAPNGYSPREIYHTLSPHPAFSPVPLSDAPASVEEQAENERMYRRLLVLGMLAVLLPTEDLKNPCLRTLVTDVLGDLILGRGIGERGCESWLPWEGMTKTISAVKARVKMKTTGTEIENDTRNRLEKFGLLTGSEESRRGERSRRGRSSIFSEVFWRLVQYAYLTFLTMRFIVLGLKDAASAAPPRSSGASKLRATAGRDDTPIASSLEAPDESSNRPILAYAIFGLLSQLLDLQTRMPWLTGIASLVQWHLTYGIVRWGARDAVLDKFLLSLLKTYAFHSSRIPDLFRLARVSLFPNNAFPPARAVPSSEEQLQIRRDAAMAILSLIPEPVASRFFCPNIDGENLKRHSDDGSSDEALKEQMVKEVEKILDSFSDNYMNKHLIYGVVELLVVRLIPELEESSIETLLEEKGVVL